MSFGSRTALSKAQMREVAVALEESGCKFLWVVKGNKVKGWVEQERILAHPAIGGFVSHCGWNSVTELAWPTHGDQRVNTEVVERARLGVWEREWGWEAGGGRLIGREEIADKLKALMVDSKEVKEKAWRAREECLLQELLLNSISD
ncbi:hypothetical protein SASPL_133440 [Salvia splendens]|uniref:Uncharacterized protein n=1 Tax=Salvia splendens TaxID=180675 RepID=A0A8X8X2P5_SALSN|nr:hypothetical protein SASPL_133440 [Salvia splendens]